MNKKPLFIKLLKAKSYKLKASNGQLMLITILILGSSLLGATVIAGFITTHNIRQSALSANSAKAIFSADAGLDEALYRCFKQATPDCASFSGQIPNSTEPTGFTYYDVTFVMDPVDPTIVKEIKSLGKSGKVARALAIEF